jgi:lipoate-protein ligase A
VIEVVRHAGTVAELHALDPSEAADLEAPEVWWCDPGDAAIVLGSRQTPDVVDADACARAGLAVVRRRSGGGAVLVRGANVVWIDVVLPPGFVPEDIRASMVWIGERWASAVRPDVSGSATVHEGGMVCTPWSDLVCFAGVGPGEVLVGDRKLVGLSQRRTRRWIRIQGMVHRRTTMAEVAGLFAGEVPAVPLPEPATLPEVDPGVVARRLADAIGIELAADTR